MSFCDNLLKTFLFITNLLIFILSCVVLGLGIWILVDSPSLVQILEQNNVSVPIYSSAVIIFIVVASAAILISFLGCCGAYKESRCMLATYFFLVLGLLILITVGTVIGMSEGIGSLTAPLKDTLYMYDTTSNRVDVKQITELWDQVQEDFHCCGVESAYDWKENPRYSGEEYIEDSGAILMGVKVPKSCCATAQDKARCQVTPSSKNGAYIVGCFELLADDISTHQNLVGGVAIAIIVIMGLDLLIAFYMCACSLGNDTDIMSRPQKRQYVRPGHLDTGV